LKEKEKKKGMKKREKIRSFVLQCPRLEHQTIDRSFDPKSPCFSSVSTPTRPPASLRHHAAGRHHRYVGF
jgi:hypothetical protein